MTRPPVFSAVVVAGDAVPRRGRAAWRGRRGRSRRGRRPAPAPRAPGPRRRRPTGSERDGASNTDLVGRANSASVYMTARRRGRHTRCSRTELRAAQVRHRRACRRDCCSSQPAVQRSPLIDAVKRQDVAAVRALLDRGADVNAAEADGSTALHWAAQRERPRAGRARCSAPAPTPRPRPATTSRRSISPRSTATPRSSSGCSTPAPIRTRTALRRPDDADDGGAVGQARTPCGCCWRAAPRSTPRAVSRADRADVGGGRRATPTRSTCCSKPAPTSKRSRPAASRRCCSPCATRRSTTAAAAAGARRQRQRRRARRLERAEHGGRQRLLRAGVDAARSRRRSRTCPIRAASPLHTIAWLRKPGADGAAGVGNTPQGTPQPTGKVTALELAKKLLEHGANPNVRVDWPETTLRQGRRHGAQSAEHPARPASAQLHRRDAVLRRRQERRRAADAAARRARRRSDDHRRMPASRR